MKKYMFSKLPYIISTAAIIGSGVLFAAGPRYEAKADHGGQCQTVDWEVGGKETSGNWEWVGGDTTVFNAYVFRDPDLYISGLSIRQDATHFVELGWHETVSSVRVYNVWWRDGSQVRHDHYGDPPLQDQEFSLGNQGNGHWLWYANNDLIDQRNLSFTSGAPYSVRENHNSCNSSEGGWWDLVKCSPSQCYSWSSKDDHDSDPHVNPQWTGTTKWEAPPGQY